MADEFVEVFGLMTARFYFLRGWGAWGKTGTAVPCPYDDVNSLHGRTDKKACALARAAAEMRYSEASLPGMK